MGICASSTREFNKLLRIRKGITDNIIKLSHQLDHLEKYPHYSRYFQRHANYTESLQFYQSQLDSTTQTLRRLAEDLGTQWEAVLQRKLDRMDSLIPATAIARLEDLDLSNLEPLTSLNSSTSTSMKPTRKDKSAKSSTSWPISSSRTCWTDWRQHWIHSLSSKWRISKTPSTTSSWKDADILPQHRLNATSTCLKTIFSTRSVVRNDLSTGRRICIHHRTNLYHYFSFKRYHIWTINSTSQPAKNRI